MIISLHIPKTGGTSFHVILRKCFKQRLLRSWYWLPVPLANSKKYDCIHGHNVDPNHYLPKVEGDHTTLITWVRDPLRRAISHYDFLFRNNPPTRGVDERPPGTEKHSYFDKFHEVICKENWSLEKFLMDEHYRNYQLQFFHGAPFSAFDWVGITDHFEDDCKFFCNQFLGKSHLKKVICKTNSGARVNPPTLSDSFRSEFTDFHSEDYNIYNKALELRADRLKQN